MNQIININNRIYHSFMIFWFLSLSLIVLGSLKGTIRFGHGMGDLIYVMSIVALIVIFGLIYIYDLYRGVPFLKLISNKYIIAFCTALLFLVLLKITFLRYGIL